MGPGGLARPQRKAAVFRTIHQLGSGWLRAVGPALAYYWAAAPPPGPAALGWAVGLVPVGSRGRPAGGRPGRVTGVEAGDQTRGVGPAAGDAASPARGPNCGCGWSGRRPRRPRTPPPSADRPAVVESPHVAPAARRVPWGCLEFLGLRASAATATLSVITFEGPGRLTAERQPDAGRRAASRGQWHTSRPIGWIEFAQDGFAGGPGPRGWGHGQAEGGRGGLRALCGPADQPGLPERAPRAGPAGETHSSKASTSPTGGTSGSARTRRPGQVTRRAGRGEGIAGPGPDGGDDVPVPVRLQEVAVGHRH